MEDDHNAGSWQVFRINNTFTPESEENALAFLKIFEFSDRWA